MVLREVKEPLLAPEEGDNFQKPADAKKVPLVVAGQRGGKTMKEALFAQRRADAAMFAARLAEAHKKNNDEKYN